MDTISACPAEDATEYLDGLELVSWAIAEICDNLTKQLGEAAPDSPEGRALAKTLSWLHDIIVQVGRGEEPTLVCPDYIAPTLFNQVVRALWTCTSSGDAVCRANSSGICQVCLCKVAQ